MSDAGHYQLMNHGDIIPQLRHQFLKDQLHLSQQLRNSAPSRLQHLDNYSVDDISLTTRYKEKSNSVTSLCPRATFRCGGQIFSNGCVVNLSHSMQVPSNSPEISEDFTPPSPLDPEELRAAFLPNSGPDANNNDDMLDDCDTISQTSSTSLESYDDRHRGFGLHITGSKAATRLASERNRDDWRHLIRQDTFKLNRLKLDSKQVNGEPIHNGNSAALPACVTETVKEKLEETVTSQDDEESLSSFSSDDTFVCDDILEDRPPTVYRSFSDSTVHRSCRRELTQKHKRRKSVHFADTSGYELEIHIPIRQSDELQVPPRLMEALDKIRAESEKKSEHTTLKHDKGGYDSLLTHYSLVLNFQQPFLEATFQCRVNQQNVCLESISILPHSLSFTGVIRVVNLDFEKQVVIRFTTNNWKTHQDIPARYVSSLTEFHQDQFSFHVVAPEMITQSRKLEMAICYALPKSKREFWDNNYGRNYAIKCLEHRGNHCDDGMMT